MSSYYSARGEIHPPPRWPGASRVDSAVRRPGASRIDTCSESESVGAKSDESSGESWWHSASGCESCGDTGFPEHVVVVRIDVEPTTAFADEFTGEADEASCKDGSGEGEVGCDWQSAAAEVRQGELESEPASCHALTGRHTATSTANVSCENGKADSCEQHRVAPMATAGLEGRYSDSSIEEAGSGGSQVIRPQVQEEVQAEVLAEVNATENVSAGSVNAIENASTVRSAADPSTQRYTSLGPTDGVGESAVSFKSNATDVSAISFNATENVENVSTVRSAADPSMRRYTSLGSTEGVDESAVSFKASATEVSAVAFNATENMENVSTVRSAADPSMQRYTSLGPTGVVGESAVSFTANATDVSAVSFNATENVSTVQTAAVPSMRRYTSLGPTDVGSAVSINATENVSTFNATENVSAPATAAVTSVQRYTSLDMTEVGESAVSFVVSAAAPSMRRYTSLGSTEVEVSAVSFKANATENVSAFNATENVSTLESAADPSVRRYTSLGPTAVGEVGESAGAPEVLSWADAYDEELATEDVSTISSKKATENVSAVATAADPSMQRYTSLGPTSVGESASAVSFKGNATENVSTVSFKNATENVSDAVSFKNATENVSTVRASAVSFKDKATENVSAVSVKNATKKVSDAVSFKNAIKNVSAVRSAAVPSRRRYTSLGPTPVGGSAAPLKKCTLSRKARRRLAASGSRHLEESPLVAADSAVQCVKTCFEELLSMSRYEYVRSESLSEWSHMFESLTPAFKTLTPLKQFHTLQSELEVFERLALDQQDNKLVESVKVRLAELKSEIRHIRVL